MSYRSICKAGGKDYGHPNYGMPCKPVQGVYNHQPRLSCVYCGKWLEPEKPIR